MKTRSTKSTTAVLIALFVAGLGIPLQAQGLDPLGPPTNPEVSIQMYSGRRNPKFELEDAQLKLIRDMIENLPKYTAEDEGAISAAYGYTGFVIGQLPAPKTSQYTIVSVYRNRIEVRVFTPAKGSTAEYKLDSERSLELLLTQWAEAKELLPQDMKEHILSGQDVRNRKKKQ